MNCNCNTVDTCRKVLLTLSLSLSHILLHLSLSLSPSLSPLAMSLSVAPQSAKQSKAFKFPLHYKSIFRASCHAMHCNAIPLMIMQWLSLYKCQKYGLTFFCNLQLAASTSTLSSYNKKYFSDSFICPHSQSHSRSVS